MHPFTTLHGVAVPMARENVDTDAMVPQRWLVTIERQGLGRALFGTWRYGDDDHPVPDFVLNRPIYQGATIVVAGANYGCGSSREHAVWAHLDWGIRAVIAPSFGPIFQENALKNGLLPVVLETAVVNDLLRQLHDNPGAACGVDLHRCAVTAPDGREHGFTLDEGRRQALLQGRDDIAQVLALDSFITAYQAHRSRTCPWSDRRPEPS